jgi:hypothetical protein
MDFQVRVREDVGKMLEKMRYWDLQELKGLVDREIAVRDAEHEAKRPATKKRPRRVKR